MVAVTAGRAQSYDFFLDPVVLTFLDEEIVRLRVVGAVSGGFHTLVNVIRKHRAPGDIAVISGRSGGPIDGLRSFRGLGAVSDGSWSRGAAAAGGQCGFRRRHILTGSQRSVLLR